MKFRLWTSGKPKNEVRIYGENSPLLGHIVPHYFEKENLSGGDNFWNFEPACSLGDHVRGWWSDRSVAGDSALTKDWMTFVKFLERCYAKEVGGPSVDDKINKSYINYGQRYYDANRGAGQANQYHDVGIYDINLGAILRQYETNSWGFWYMWSSGSPLCERMRGKAGSSQSMVVVFNRIMDAWNDEIRKR